MNIKRNYIDWLITLLFFTVLSSIAFYKPDWFGIQGWIKYVWVIVALLLAPTLYYLAARHLFPNAFPIRIRIRPLVNLHEDSSYNGLAVARLMELDMQPQIPSGETKSRVRMETTTRQLKLSVAGATIPLEVIIHKLNCWIFGPIHTIEGVISEIDGGIRLEAWTSESLHHWQAESSTNPGSDPLRTAIRDMADQIKGTFGYYQELVEKYEAQNQYTMAIYFCQQLDLASRKTTLGYLYLAAGRLNDAEREFGKQLENDYEDIREDAIRGLGLSDIARGHYDDAINLFDQVSGNQKFHAILDKVMSYCYQGEFKSAQFILVKLVSEVDASFEKLMGTPRKDIETEAVISRFDKLIEEDWIKAYDYLWVLADAYGLLGRCLQEFGEHNEADQHFDMAIDVLWQRQQLVDQVHQVYLDLGVRYEDLQLFDEAIIQYDNCIEDAQKHYQEDPQDLFSLTNMAWAATGNLACAMKKIMYDPLSKLDDIEVQRQVDNVTRQLSSLLIKIPEDQWYSIVISALEYLRGKSKTDKILFEPISELSSNEIEQIATLLKSISELTNIQDTQHIMGFVILITKGYQGEIMARQYYQILMNQTDRCHIAEAYFGLACIEVIIFNYEIALVYLMYALTEMPELRNRARLDEDLRVLKDTEEFQRLVAWPH